MFDLDSLRTDSTKENDGVEVPLGGDSSITIAAWQNDNFVTMLTKEMEPYAALQRINKVPEDVAERVLIKVIAHTIIKGWKNIGTKGELIEYSPEAAIQQLASKRFRAFVIENSQNLALFKNELREDAVKN